MMDESESTKSPSKQEIYARWVERDLTAEADRLPRAFECEDTLRELIEILDAGRFPILIGEPGVGKTALAHELARRIAHGDVPSFLRDQRIIQISLERFASGLSKPREDLPPRFLEFVETLIAEETPPLLFLRDIHNAYRFDLEQQLLSLAYRHRGGILGEGLAGTVLAMLEMEEELQQRYYPITIEEPSLERTTRIVERWSEELARSRHIAFTNGALDQALHLSHRFLARSRQPRKVLELLDQLAAKHGARRPIDVPEVFDRFCSRYKIPRQIVDPDVPLDLGDLETSFGERILGQPEAISAIVSTIGQIKAGLSDVRRPLGVFLFTGPTGVGKTHVAKLLAEYLFGSEERIVRVNMADYEAPEAAFVLFGNPQAHSLSFQRGTLTQRLQGHQIAVLLLDEFEKAHEVVHDRFLQLIDEGSFINGASETVSCRSTIIIATTNAGAEIYRGKAFGFRRNLEGDALRSELDRRLEEHFRFEFLNRFDRVVHFQPLSRAAIRTIALRELEQLQHRSGIRQRQLEIEFDESVLDWLTVHGYDPDYGARFLRRIMERSVTASLADTIVRENPPAGSRLEVIARGTRILSRLVPTYVPGRSDRSEVELAVGTETRTQTLDAEALHTLVMELRHASRPLLDELERKREEHSALLEQMNQPTFWERGPDRARCLDRFRELDVAIRVEERLAHALRNLDALPTDPGTRDLAKIVEAASHAFREWQDRAAERGPTALWLVISNVDPLRDAGSWIEEVAGMERAWCRRVHLDCEIAGFELADDHVERLALSIEGPGALGYLAMEEGVHRMHRSESADLRARIDLVPRSEGDPGAWAEMRRLDRSRRLPYPADVRARLGRNDSGTFSEWFGTCAAGFEHMLHDLTAAWSAGPTQAKEVARSYRRAGQGAHDPRTGTTIAHARDALRGKLDAFLEAWRRRGSTTRNA
ncbi:MAG: AAA family ATPase [Planctomycetes bacterium]|nr:AAA family ATPase [Planctomycetota bacterium]